MLYKSQKLHEQYTKDIWEFFDNIRGITEIYSSNILVIVGYLILLRLVDFQERQISNAVSEKNVLDKVSIWDYITNLSLSELNFFEIEKERSKLSLRFDKYQLEEAIRDLYNFFEPHRTDRRVIKSALDLVSKVPMDTFSGRENLFIAYETLIKTINSRYYRHLEKFIPSQIAALMVNLADPKLGESIYDPSMGLGDLLVESVYKIKKNTNLALTQEQQKKFYGIVSYRANYFITKIRMILAGIDTPKLEEGYALHKHERRNRSQNELKTFDCILSFPPFGATNQKDYFYTLPCNTKFTETLFLQHILLSLNPNGRAVICLPEVALSRSVLEYEVRNWLLSKFRIEGVLSLPATAFKPCFNIKFNIIVLRHASPSTHSWFQKVQKKDDPFSSNSFHIDVDQETESFHSHKGLGRWVSQKDIKDYGFELETKKLADDELEILFSSLKQKDQNIKIIPLNEVADIFIGLKYDRKDQQLAYYLLREEKIPLQTPVISAKHLDNEKIHRSSEFLPGNPAFFPSKTKIPTETKSIDKKYYLLEGDLLMSRFLGKLALVQDQTVGTVALNNLFIIRPNKDIYPQYLLNLFKSGTYRYWLATYSSGLATQYLSINLLRSLKIPVPPKEVQEQIVMSITPEADVSEILRAFVTGQNINEFSSFLMSTPIIQELLTRVELFDEVSISNKFNSLAIALRPWRNLAAHQQLDTDLDTWLLSIFNIIESVAYAFQLAEVERLAILENLRLPFEQFQSLTPKIKETLRLRVSTINKFIFQLMQTERKKIIETVNIVANLETPILQENKITELVIKLKNEGTLTLRNFRAKAQAEKGHTEHINLQPQKEVSLIINFPAKPVGQYPIRIDWEAVRFDLAQIRGSISVVCEVRSSEKISNNNLTDFGKNPYIVGNPIDRSEMFFGRQLVIDKIKRQLDAKNQANIVLLEGNRRTGKSSILRYLERSDELSKSIPIYFSFQGVEGDDKQTGLHTRDVYYSLAREIAVALNKANYPIEIPDIGKIESSRFFLFRLRKVLDKYFDAERPFELFEILLTEFLNLITPKRILLMLDEFDKLQEGIDNKITSPQVPENIRYLFHTYPQLSGIITGSRRLKRLREEYWSALFGLGYRIGLEPLEFEEAQLLITKPVDNLLIYTDEARNKVVVLCARQPFLIQSLCSRIFDYCAENHQIQVNTKIVDLAATELIRDNEHFRTLWGYAGTERRRFILWLTYELSKQIDVINIDLLEIKLKELKIIIPNGENIGDDVDFLYELELLEKQSFGESTSYRIAIPLMAMWIEKHIDGADIRKRAVDEGEKLYDN